jgi:hypothetical protein
MQIYNDIPLMQPYGRNLVIGIYKSTKVIICNEQIFIRTQTHMKICTCELQKNSLNKIIYI